MKKYFPAILLILIIVALLIIITIIFYINKSNYNELTINYTMPITNISKTIDYITMLNTSKTLIEKNTTESFTFRYNITIIDFKINVENVYFNNETGTYTVLLNWTIYAKSNTNYTYPVIFYEYETAEGEGALVASIEEKVYPNKITKIESNIHQVIFKGSEKELYYGTKTFKIIIAYPSPYEPGKGKARLIFYNLSGNFIVYVP
ncbi:MAG: hypothetical protein QXF09_02545 [Nitrososphaerota archaeon]